MTKIPFRISARTALLIGRENVASPKGAIIELVKNGYDADSPLSLIYFHQKKDCLYIIDSGEGMTQSVIEKHWMTIGTDNKTNDIITKTGRVKAGAKGIGRFALDKLGDCCVMTTKPKNAQEASIWHVDWRDFEVKSKTIDSITADLSTQKKLDLKQYLLDEISDKKIQDIINKHSFNSGTVLKISNLRDNWDDYFVSQVFDDLAVLAPPKEQNDFKLFLYSYDNPNKYGEILGSICDDYDYKLVAKADQNQNVNIEIFRNEYDVETIPPEFFKREFAQKMPYTKDAFKDGKWTKNTTFSELLPGFKDVDKDNVFKEMGEFEFTFYFMKKTYSTPDLEKFYYNKFDSNSRKDWLNKFGGIKVFRDEFRVRPYGEVKDSAFDWLGLGGRKAKSPATPSKPDGRWRVGPDNIAGNINITRLGNLAFEDKSSREGLQENKTFQILKQIILKILDILEVDRAIIAKEMKFFYDDLHGDVNVNVKKDADKLAKKILENERKKQNSQYGDQSGNDKETVILSKRIEEKDEEIEAMESEQKILRGMATSGIVTASFSHELGNLSDVLNSRTSDLIKMLEEKQHPNLYQDTPDFLNPYVLIKEMRKQDAKLQSWLKFSLTSARKDKRRRKKIILDQYFKSLQSTWQNTLSNRMICLEYNLDNKKSDLRAMEIDLDSIFNNLIVNSIDSFIKHKTPKRKIKLKISNTNKEIIVDYFDNGGGLSPDIIEHSDIFKALYTTKRNEHTGEEIGTGLGMWLIEAIIKEYNGNVKLLYPNNKGFGIRISFIQKHIRE